MNATLREYGRKVDAWTKTDTGVIVMLIASALILAWLFGLI
jgi:hypothetical protein